MTVSVNASIVLVYEAQNMLTATEDANGKTRLSSIG